MPINAEPPSLRTPFLHAHRDGLGGLAERRGAYGAEVGRKGRRVCELLMVSWPSSPQSSSALAGPFGHGGVTGAGRVLLSLVEPYCTLHAGSGS